MTDPIIARLALEELVFLLRGEKIATLPGLNQDFLAGLDRDHQDLAFAVADRTLRARRYLFSATANDRVIEPVVAGVLREAAQPQTIIELRKTTPGNEQIATFSVTPKFVVERAEIEPGIHHFVAVAGIADGIELVLEHIHLDQSDATYQEITLSHDAWQAAIDALRSTPDVARARFVAALTPGLGEQSYGALTASTPQYALSTMSQGIQGVRQLLVAQSDAAIVLIETRTADVRIQVTDATHVRQAIAAFTRSVIVPVMRIEAT